MLLSILSLVFLNEATGATEQTFHIRSFEVDGTLVDMTWRTRVAVLDAPGEPPLGQVPTIAEVRRRTSAPDAVTLDLTNAKSNAAATVLVARFFESLGLDVNNKDEVQFGLRFGGYGLVLTPIVSAENGGKLNAYINYTSNNPANLENPKAFRTALLGFLAEFF